MNSPSDESPAGGAVIATAIHNGDDLRPELADFSARDGITRLREEDPHTARVASWFGNHIVLRMSRFEVHLNRPRSTRLCWSIRP